MRTASILLSTLTSVAAFSISPNKHHSIQVVRVAAIITATVTAPHAALAGDVQNGEQLFNNNCAACHAGGQNVIMPNKTLEKEALETYLAGGRSEKSIISQVTNGKNAMPAFGGRLGDDQIADVAAYVMATSEKGWYDN
eukprot:80620_1